MSSPYLDTREDRFISPFLNWLVEETTPNHLMLPLRFAECEQVVPPTSVFCMSPFVKYSLDGRKAVLRLGLGQCPTRLFRPHRAGRQDPSGWHHF